MVLSLTIGVGIPDGKGEKQADLIEALTAVFRQGIYHFTDERFKPTSPVSEYFRIQFRFGRPVVGFSNAYVFLKRLFQVTGLNQIYYRDDRKDEQWQKFRVYINSKLSFFQSIDSAELPVMFGGNSITDFEILQTVWGDAKLAMASLFVVFLRK
jgi:hypothetical protein